MMDYDKVGKTLDNIKLPEWYRSVSWEVQPMHAQPAPWEPVVVARFQLVYTEPDVSSTWSRRYIKVFLDFITPDLPSTTLSASKYVCIWPWTHALYKFVEVVRFTTMTSRFGCMGKMIRCAHMCKLLHWSSVNTQQTELSTESISKTRSHTTRFSHHKNLMKPNTPCI